MIVHPVIPSMAAALLLLLAMPVLLPLVIGIQAVSPGPIFFRQTRVGKYGQIFRMWKLRTMVVNAEEQLRELILRDRAAAAEWEAYGRLADDPRIARPFGRWARRFSIDELPQLFNVTAGDMAFVGPRPLLPAQVAELLPRTRALREAVAPGLTGLWQVCGRSETTLKQMLRLDLLYIRRRSLFLDLYILARTPAAVISARGAF